MSPYVPICLTNRRYCETGIPVTRSAFLGRTGRGAGLLDKDYPSPAKGRRESGRRLHSPQMCSHALCCRFEPVRASLEGAIPSCRRAFGPYPPCKDVPDEKAVFRDRAPVTHSKHLPPHKGKTRRTPPKASAPTVPPPAHHGKSSRACYPASFASRSCQWSRFWLKLLTGMRSSRPCARSSSGMTIHVPSTP